MYRPNGSMNVNAVCDSMRLSSVISHQQNAVIRCQPMCKSIHNERKIHTHRTTKKTTEHKRIKTHKISHQNNHGIVHACVCVSTFLRST